MSGGRGRRRGRGQCRWAGGGPEAPAGVEPGRGIGSGRRSFSEDGGRQAGSACALGCGRRGPARGPWQYLQL